MYVYRTSQFNGKAERYGIQDRIDDLCAELETQRIDEVQARFERVYPYLKRRILNRRLIARILKVDDEQILCLLDIFKRGDTDYEQFLEAPVEYGKNHLESQLDEQQLRDWLTRAKSEQHPVEPLPDLPSELHPWLELPSWDIDTAIGDWVIYESEAWVTQFRKPEIEQAWKIYYQMILGIRDHTLESFEIANLPNVKLCNAHNRYVLYSELETSDTVVGGVLFLLAPFEREPSPTDITQVGLITGLFERIDLETDNEDTLIWGREDMGNSLADVSELPTIRTTASSSTEVTHNLLARQLHLYELTPFARRSYPAYLLADEESWLAIERGKEANLALSPEEEQILKSVSTATPGSGSLPLFINGRAGSGKSTMLLYLFADYCYRKYYDKHGHCREQPLAGEPLFLTYNERLLDVAQEGVKTLLESHHRFVAEGNQGWESDRIAHLFQPFQKLLFSLLPPQERSRFDPEKYISFHRFKQLYQGNSPCESLSKAVLHLPQARRYSPEMSWHVIRSFIKGYGLEEYMTPQDYQEEVPRKERTVSVDKFQGIYETIWERWYHHLTTEQGFWDDQDLIAKVLTLKCYQPQYTAIFCDEAQDFTKLELQLIMRLSIFSQYHLGYQPIQSLPFAFAGDPFQTLNPTGFHWSSVQSIFDAEVLTALDPADQLKLTINFQELAYNYRSSPPIVQLTNLIQLWRHVILTIPELQPQTAWHPSTFPEPQKFILNQNINLEELKAYIKDTIIIVPCEEGEEITYVQSDEVLSEIFPHIGRRGDGDRENTSNLPSNDQTLKLQQPPKNVLSAIAAKGLEFKKVILYKFGENCDRHIWSLRGKDINQKVKVEYFFNKLYVAASRATERLFVVDSENGDHQLWQYASDEALLQAMLQFARNRERWQENVRTISPGTPKTVKELREDNPQAIAQEFETKGLNAQNPELLRRARQFYSDLGATIKARVCEAWALRFEEHFSTAGNLFLELGEVNQAWECFWQGMCWPQLVAWYNEHPEIRSVERSLATFMIAQPQDLGRIKEFTNLLRSQLSSTDTQNQRLNNEQLFISHQWKKAVEEYVHRLEMLLNVTDLNLPEWHQIGEVLQALVSVGYSEFCQLAGECFYRGENYEQAVRQWDACGDTQTPEYNQAKVRVLDHPERLEDLAQVGNYDRIIQLWEEAGKPRDRRWLNYVAPAWEAKQQYQQAFVVYVWLDNLPKVKQCFKTASQETPPIKLFAVFIQYLYRKQYWQEAIEAVETYLPKISGSEQQKAVLKFNVIYEIAISELKPENLTKDERRHYHQFIKTQISAPSDWQQYLLMQQVGIALEKIGSLRGTLEFYEQFISHPDKTLRQFARERWIAIKKKQEEYARRQGQTEKANKSQSELVKQGRIWSVALQSVPLDPPPAPKERPTTELLDTHATLTDYIKPHTAAKLIIKGLPKGTKVEQLEAGVIQFTIRHLVIRVMRPAKQVLITDVLNNRDIRLDWAQCQVNIGEAMIETDSGNSLSFTLFGSTYKGHLLYTAKQPRLELEIQGLSNKISIEL